MRPTSAHLIHRLESLRASGIKRHWYSVATCRLATLAKKHPETRQSRKDIKENYVGLTWATGNTKGGLAMQCDKNDYRGVLAGLEGVTGKKAADTDAMNVKN